MNNKPRLRLYFSICLLLLNASQVNATSILELNFNQVCQQAELIFEGEVVATKMQISPKNGQPYTYITFKILDVIKGNYTENTLDLAFLGGIKNGRLLSVSGLHLPQLNERGIFFVESTDNEQVHPLVGWDQGHYLVTLDTIRNELVVAPQSPHPLTKSLIQTPSLNDFKQTIRQGLLDSQ